MLKRKVADIEKEAINSAELPAFGEGGWVIKGISVGVGERTCSIVGVGVLVGKNIVGVIVILVVGVSVMFVVGIAEGVAES